MFDVLFEIIFFFSILKKYLNKNWIYFDVIFPMQLSEFIKSANFVSNLKKTEEKKRKNYIFNQLEFHLAHISVHKYFLKYQNVH